MAQSTEKVTGSIIVSGHEMKWAQNEKGTITLAFPADMLRGGTGPKWIAVGEPVNGLQARITFGFVRQEPRDTGAAKAAKPKGKRS